MRRSTSHSAFLISQRPRRCLVKSRRLRPLDTLWTLYAANDHAVSSNERKGIAFVQCVVADELGETRYAESHGRQADVKETLASLFCLNDVNLVSRLSAYVR